MKKEVTEMEIEKIHSDWCNLLEEENKGLRDLTSDQDKEIVRLRKAVDHWQHERNEAVKERKVIFEKWEKLWREAGLDELNPCPFCKSKSVVFVLMGSYNYVRCTDCNATGPLHRTKDRAAEVWNKVLEEV